VKTDSGFQIHAERRAFVLFVLVRAVRGKRSAKNGLENFFRKNGETVIKNRRKSITINGLAVSLG
jgi:hypothetical protein